MPTNRSNSSTLKSLSPAIDQLLSRLRSRIRWFVLFEGIATAMGWLLLTFWVALAIDYLPVTFGFFELSQTLRGAILVLTGGLIVWVLHRLVVRRIFVRMKNRSMAMLIERRYRQFGDSLLTTVNWSDSSSIQISVDDSMLDRTRIEAEGHLKDVDLSEVVSSRPMRRSLTFAGVLLVSMVVFAIAKPAVLKIAAQRLYFLEAITWPRRCQIELVGIKVNRENPVEGIDEIGQFLVPLNDEFRCAKGSTLTILVRAKGGAQQDEQRLPDNCSLIYRTDDGIRGVQALRKIGTPRDGFQLYSFDGQPLRGILDGVTFDVRGGDHRLGPYKLSVVDEPYVFETKLELHYPAYIVDEDSGSWMDRTIDWSGQARVPEGTDVTILAKSKKQLTKVYAFDRIQKLMSVIEASGNEFRFKVPNVSQPVSFQFFLCDTDGLVAEQPHTITIDPIEDQPPIIQSRLSGIGTAVTPDVQIPITGSVDDDYGLGRTWVEIQIADSPLIEVPIVVSDTSEIDMELDFKLRRQEMGSDYELPFDNESQLQLVIISEDESDLGVAPNMGIGDRYTLDIVSPNQLLLILERLEVGQRQRLEQIFRELTDARRYLIRSKSGRSTSQNELVEPGDNESDNVLADSEGDLEQDGGDDPIRKQELRLLFVQRAMVQVDKSRQEIVGSAEAFDNIRMQLINNRIDSEDKKIRISDQIIAPLRLIGDQSMQQLKASVNELEATLRGLQLSPQDLATSQLTNQHAQVAIGQLDLVLRQLDSVLGALVKYETQNELLEIVRQMIKTQKALMERTKQERQRKAFDGLLD